MLFLILACFGFLRFGESVCRAAPSEAILDGSYVATQENICGQYSLAVILRSLGREVELHEIVSVLPGSKTGSTLRELGLLAEAYGFFTSAVQLSAKDLFAVRTPAILHVEGGHFVALVPNEESPGCSLFDPTGDVLVVDPQDLDGHLKWDGYCLLIDNSGIDLTRVESHPLRALFFLCVSGIAFLVAAILAWKTGVLGRLRAKGSQGGSVAALLAMLLLESAPFLSAAEPGEESGPRISMSETEYDAGVVFEDTKLIEFSFDVNNVGTDVLIIEDVKVACSCLKCTCREKEVAPGGATKIDVEYRLGWHFGDLAVQKIWVSSNDAQQPGTELSVRVKRVREFQVRPKRANLGVLDLGKERIFLVRITSFSGDRELDLERMTATSDYLTVEQMTDDFSGDGSRDYLLRLTLSATAPVGPTYGLIRIPCDGKSVKQIEIPVQWEVVGPVRLSLSELSFGILTNHSSVRSKRILLWSQIPVVVNAAESSQSWIVPRGGRVDGRRYGMTVEILCSKVPVGSIDEEILVHTNHEQMKTIRIPVSGYCLGK